MSHWSDALPRDACPEAREWCRTQPDYPTAWETCPRGDWLLWLAERSDVNRRLLVLAACDCARLSLRYVPAGETRPLRAIEAAEAWTRGEATLEEVRIAVDAAYSATEAYAWTSAAAAAAESAALAAKATYDPTEACGAANSAALAARADGSDSVIESAMHAECARLVRARIARPGLKAREPSE